jgi:hypothetical protein
MRRFLSISFIALALVVCAVGAVSSAPVVVHAQQATVQAAVPASGANPTNTLPNPAGSSTVLVGVIQWIMMLFAWLVGVAALALDYAVYYTVVTMGNYVHNLTAIGVVWRILRDISNIALIFGFLAIGINTILGSSKYGWTTKLLPMLLAAAVFLNFSLFISEAVIDVGNMFATEFYTQINGGVLPVGTPAGITANNIVLTTANEGISDRIMGQLGLQTIYTVNGVNKNVFSDSNSWAIGFLGIILFLITAFVMFSLAFILITRFIYLVFLIMVAPIGFAGLAIPKLDGIAKQWWGALFDQTITAPVLLLMLYIALAVITDVHFLTGFCTPPAGSTTCTVNWLGFTSGTGLNLPGFASMLLSFLVAMGLLLAVVVFAKKLGAAGAGWATKTAGKVTFGTVSLAGRATLGMTGNALASDRMKKWGNSNNVIGRYAARIGTFTGKRLQNQTYDVRNSSGFTKGLAAVGSALGGSIDIGKGAKLTAKQAQEAQYGLKPVKESFRESAKKRDEAAARLKRKDTLVSGTPSELQKELKKMSDDEIAELRGIRLGQDRFVQALSPTAFGNLMKNKNLLDSEKTSIRNSWNAQFATHATSAAALGRMSEDERVALGGATLTKPEVYKCLNADDFDNVRGKLQPAEKATIGAYVRGIVDGSILVPASAPPTLQADLVAAAGNPKFKAYYNIP